MSEDEFLNTDTSLYMDMDRWVVSNTKKGSYKQYATYIPHVQIDTPKLYWDHLEYIDVEKGLEIITLDKTTMVELGHGYKEIYTRQFKVGYSERDISKHMRDNILRVAVLGVELLGLCVLEMKKII